jgi:hypothetical protein
MNSFDDGDDIVIDLSVFKDHSVMYLITTDQMRHPLDYPATPRGTPRRFRLKNVSSTQMEADAEVTFSVPEIKGMELPTVHPRCYYK